jgi:hypothetical protein
MRKPRLRLKADIGGNLFLCRSVTSWYGSVSGALTNGSGSGAGSSYFHY